MQMTAPRKARAPAPTRTTINFIVTEEMDCKGSEIGVKDRGKGGDKEQREGDLRHAEVLMMRSHVRSPSDAAGAPQALLAPSHRLSAPDGTALSDHSCSLTVSVLLSCSPPRVTMGTVARGGARACACVRRSRGDLCVCVRVCKELKTFVLND